MASSSSVVFNLCLVIHMDRSLVSLYVTDKKISLSLHYFYVFLPSQSLDFGKSVIKSFCHIFLLGWKSYKNKTYPVIQASSF